MGLLDGKRRVEILNPELRKSKLEQARASARARVKEMSAYMYMHIRVYQTSPFFFGV